MKKIAEIVVLTLIALASAHPCLGMSSPYEKDESEYSESECEWIGWSEPALHQLVLEGDLNAVQRLLKEDPTAITKCDQFGHTALHDAAASECAIKIVDLLLKFDANPDAIDKDGCSPLHLACSPEIIKILLTAKADPEIRNKLGKTPLICTVQPSTSTATHIEIPAYYQALPRTLLEQGVAIDQEEYD